jgi:hypothetical protein
MTKFRWQDADEAVPANGGEEYVYLVVNAWGTMQLANYSIDGKGLWCWRHAKYPSGTLPHVIAWAAIPIYPDWLLDDISVISFEPSADAPSLVETPTLEIVPTDDK